MCMTIVPNSKHRHGLTLRESEQKARKKYPQRLPQLVLKRLIGG
jgi:hypothetical protein